MMILSWSLHMAICTPLSTTGRLGDITPSDGTRASRQALQADLANALERSTRQTVGELLFQARDPRVTRTSTPPAARTENSWRKLNHRET
jgi:hypothetical protein